VEHHDRSQTEDRDDRANEYGFHPSRFFVHSFAD
jgi:hypothetical protein